MPPDSYHQYLEMVRTLSEYDLERRRGLRVCPHPQRPLTLHLQDGSHLVIDISTGGLSFFSPTPFPPDYWLPGRLELPGRDHPLELTLMVVAHEGGNLVRCRFAGDIQDEASEHIRGYIQQRLAEIEQAA